MALYQFPVTRRFNRYFARLVKGSLTVHTLLENGQVISAEKKYNKLCMDYAECRILLKRRAEEIEKRKQFAEGLEELARVKAAFLDFYSLAEQFKVDIASQREDTLRFMGELEALFAAKC